MFLNRNLKCVPKKKIGFLKAHKCASSSIQNVLFRYVIKNNLNVVLPKQGNYLDYFIPEGKSFESKYLGPDLQFNRHSSRFNRRMLADTIWEKAHLHYDIFLCHTQWDHQEISHVLNDLGDGFYFSMIREPFESESFRK